MDRQWWDYHIEEVHQVFRGALLAPIRRGGVTFMQKLLHKASNSGAGAMLAAAEMGAQKLVLLGYDCQKTGGRAHWHPDHPTKPAHGHRKGLGNAGSVDKWPGQFEQVAKRLRHLQIVNCSRATALTCFPRQPLEATLADPARS